MNLCVNGDQILLHKYLSRGRRQLRWMCTTTYHHHQPTSPICETLTVDAASSMTQQEFLILWKWPRSFSDMPIVFRTVGCLPSPWIAPEASSLAQPQLKCLKCLLTSTYVLFAILIIWKYNIFQVISHFLAVISDQDTRHPGFHCISYDASYEHSRVCCCRFCRLVLSHSGRF